MQTEDQVRGVVEEYMHRSGYLMGLDQTACEEMGVRLFNTGKIIEPRSNGIHAMSVPRDYVWMDLFPTVTGVRSDTVRTAWEQYRTLITLTEQLPEAGYVPEHQKIQPLTAEDEAKQKAAIDLLIRSMV
jgi:hypothetical protein